MKMIVKTWLCLVTLLCSAQPLAAQTFKEWFRQKKTQREYLIQQVAALRAYAGYLRSGYGIIRDGAGLIGDITGGEFGLHSDYFGSLEKVRPELLADGKVASILTLHRAMEKERFTALAAVDRSEYATAAEKDGIRKSMAGLAGACEAELQELELVTTDGKLELDDSDRLKRIDRIYGTTRTLYALHRNVIPRIISLVENRERNSKDIEILRKIFGVAQ
ncbi:hypothetical protein JHJ32_07380 [Parapedobacter sp. ISTM3]|uniref:hypothetical protein n=1 Tax=Parapedobacter sp. ISTM3 TaxID=2800130 RepID=UPI0019059B0A|nr:hypothetical protein [Parapedobacter sp. ISTM3]MBK1439799.1 hypothetical protein [Parapedobacter sp. ISTM3]